MREILGYLFMLNGVFFFIATAVAMIRFPDFYTRLHASSKCLTGGGLSVLLGGIILTGFNTLSFKLLLLMIFLVLTNPVTAHAIANVAYKIGVIPDVIQDDLKAEGD